MNREERADSTDSVVTDDSEDPLTCPYGEPPLGLSAASLPYDGGSPYA